MTAVIEKYRQTSHHAGRYGFWKLTLGSVGVVYGDIGTSPLYAMKEAVGSARAGGAIDATLVIGVTSLIVWALTIIVTLKYVVVILRADNDGEGGTLSLMTLAQQALGGASAVIALLGMAGAALFYGDAVITPAISVLSAVEGLEIVAPGLTAWVMPLSLAILLILFAVQKNGTAAVAGWFGPVMAAWFIILALGGLVHIFERPGIVLALDPRRGLHFIAGHGTAGFLTLGSVFLAVTGAEALYADMGHFRRGPIQFAWLALVFPTLAINYLGQGALLIGDPAALENPFFLMFPPWALLPMVLFATVATVIASQAVITGAYSMTQQAMQAGFLPRFQVTQTSDTEKGQIYLPRVNWLLLIAVLFLVGAFRSSEKLAAAYGIAVTGTMVISAVLAFVVAWRFWRWPVVLAALTIVPFLAIDLVFLSANLFKLAQGGWLPLLIGANLVVVMLTWRRGSRLLADRTRRHDLSLSGFLPTLERHGPERVSGTAFFFTSYPDAVPTALLHNLKHNKVLHRQNVILTVVTEDRPRVAEDQRVTLMRLSDTFVAVTLRFGYREEPNVPRALALCRRAGLTFDVMNTSFFLSRRSLRPAARSAMPVWQDRLYIKIARTSDDASAYFHLPTERTVEIGTQIVI